MMSEKKTQSAEKLIDAVTEQPESVRVGERIFDIPPRTLKQLRAIEKHITTFRDELFDAVKEAENATETELEEGETKD